MGAVLRSTRIARLGLAAGSLAVLLLILNIGSGFGECGGENTGCARQPLRLWQGRVFAATAVPLVGATVIYHFASREAFRNPLVPRPLTLRTDYAGRYCLRWPTESQGASVQVSGGVPAGTVDARYVAIAAASAGPLIVSPDASASPGGYLISQDPVALGHETNAGWIPAFDAGGACIAASPPWYRMEDLGSDWHSRLLEWVGLVSLGLLMLGLLVRFGRRAAGVALMRGALGLALLGAALYIPIWITHTI